MRTWSLDINGKPFIAKQEGSRQFRVTFDVLSKPGDAIAFADIGIYNLAQGSAVDQRSDIILRAGYDDREDIIFTGRVTNSFRERSGTNIITRLLCQAGVATDGRGSANGSYGRGASVVDVLQDLARSWPCQLVIDADQFKDSPVFTSGYQTNGDIPTALNDLAYMFDFDWSNERGQLVVNKKGAPRTSAITKINPFTGMIGFPESEMGPDGLGVKVSCLLNPYIRVGGRIEVESEYQGYNTGNMYVVASGEDAKVSGEYNVFELRHKGDSHGNEWLTQVSAMRATLATAGKTGGMAWGGVVDQHFRVRVREIAKNIGVEADWLMAVMAFETGGKFTSGVVNMGGSGATGLIQFMPSIARNLGTSTAALSRMTPVEQLDWVEKYFNQPMFRGRLKTLGDTYMAVLWPKAVGKPDSFVLWTAGTKEYHDNAGLDKNKDGVILRGEAVERVNKSLTDGLKRTE